jgi:hypothetical protein
MAFPEIIVSRGTPTPGCFCERVRNRLKTKELSFAGVQKSSQEYQKKGDRSEEGCNFQNGSFGYTPGSFRKSGKQRR